MHEDKVDFGGTDAPLTDSEAVTKSLVQIPIVAGAVVPIFNVPGVRSLVLNGKLLGQIYAGKIETWNDRAIAQLNQRVALPNLPIIVAHRSDGSGTTNIFTTYLTKVSVDWTQVVSPSKGTAIDWPVDKLKRGLGGNGNQGVADAVRQTARAIGYVELSFAVKNKLAYTQMINAAGQVVNASAASTTTAIRDAVFNDRFAADIQDSKQTTAWPISGFTYVLLHKDYKDCAKAQKLTAWITWGVTSQDARVRATKLLYSVLPSSITPKVTQALKGVTCNGAPIS